MYCLVLAGTFSEFKHGQPILWPDTMGTSSNCTPGEGLVETKRSSSTGGPKPATVSQLANTTGIHKIIESQEQFELKEY